MTLNDMIHRRRTFEAEGVAAGAAPAGEPAPAAAAAAAAPAGGAAKWFEDAAYSPEERSWLAAKGLAEDDPMAAMPKLIKGHRAAEQRIGKGLDTIIEKPAKDQPYDAWVAANREALGLPADEKGYAVTPPEGWPKDLPWDTAMETQAKAVALKYGIPPAALQELVNMQAQGVMAAHGQVGAEVEAAKGALMADLQKDWSDQTPAKITLAKQAAQTVAQAAGMDMQAIANMSELLMDKTGDANVIRFMAQLGSMMADDVGQGIGKGGPMTMTPAEARQQLAQLRAPEGEYYKASEKRDHAALAALRPKMDNLAKIAAQG